MKCIQSAEDLLLKTILIKSRCQILMAFDTYFCFGKIPEDDCLSTYLYLKCVLGFDQS